MDDMQALRELNKRFIHNYVTNDVASHDAILHPAFMYISSTGKRVDRQNYLAGWATGFDPHIITYWDMRHESITIIGATALVRASNKFTEMVNGKPVTGMAGYTDVYIKEHGKWLCVQAQILNVAPENWPGDETIVTSYVKGVQQA